MRGFRRLSIRHLMGLVIGVAVGVTALRSRSAVWTSIVMLGTWAVLGLAAIGAACRRGAKRAWWLGFAASGAGYLALVYAGFILPTEPLLSVIEPMFHQPSGEDHSNSMHGWTFHDAIIFFSFDGTSEPEELAVWRRGVKLHHLAALGVAALGGLVAARLFGAGGRDRGELRRGWSPRRPALVGGMGLLGFAVVAFVGLRWVPGPATAVVMLATWGILGLTAVGAVCNRGQRRAAFLGAAVFGLGFLVLVVGPKTSLGYWPRVGVGHLLVTVQGWLPRPMVAETASRSDPFGRDNRRILAALDRRVALRYPNDVTLADLMKRVQGEMREEGQPPIPIYIDPQGLADADRTEASTLRIDLEGVRLGTGLRLALKPLGLTYEVSDGMVVVTSFGSDEEDPTATEYAVRDDMDATTPFRVVGGCVLALMAALVGGLLGPWVARPGSAPAAPSPGDSPR